MSSGGGVLASALGVGGFIISIINFVHDRLKEKREPLRAEVLSVIATLKNQTATVAVEMDRHLMGQKGAASKDTIYRMEADVRRYFELLQNCLPSKETEILKAAGAWWRDLSSDGFPANRTGKKLSGSDARIKLNAQAQNTIAAFLDEIRMACLCDRIVYWKPKSARLGHR